MSLQFIGISLLFYGCFFCMIAALCIFMSRNYAPKKRKWMVLLQLSAAAVLGFDALGWIYYGDPGTTAYYVVRISNFVVFAGSYLTLLFFYHYMCAYLFETEHENWPMRGKTVEIICLSGVLLVVLSQITGWYYTFDAENVYHRGNGYPIAALLLIAGIILELSLIVQNRRQLKKNSAVLMEISLLLPLVSAVVGLLQPDNFMSNLALGISLTLLFVLEVSEQNEELERLSRREAKAVERLEIASMLNRCVKELSSDTDIDVSIHNLLGIILDYFEADRTYIFEYDFDREILINTYEYVKGQVTEQIENLQEVPFEVIEVWMRAFERDNFFYISDLEQEKDSNYYDILHVQDIQQLLAVPLRKKDQIIGFLGVDNPKAHNEDPTLLSSLQYFVTNSLERKRKKAYLKAMSYHDLLTGLYNRNRYMEVIGSEAAHHFTCVGAAYMDLNGLKRMNDECGHAAGDELIRRCADVLSEIFPKKCYRIGGDEFVILVPDTKEEAFYEKIKLVRKKMQEQEVSISLGALWQENPGDLTCMLRLADERMYVEKEQYHKKLREEGREHEITV